MPTQQNGELLASLKKVAASLREADIDFVLGGGLAAWARGGPATEHDIDLLIREEDVDDALRVLEEAGLRPERPPEDWLVKAWDGDVLVDLIFRPVGLTVDDDLIANAELLNVHAIAMRVLSMVDLLFTKMLALTEHNLDFAPLLEHARSLREQVDWEVLRERTRSSPFARAFLYMVAELGIAPGASPVTRTVGGEDDPVCLEANLREALATDPRVGELGLNVTVTGEDVVVTGSVSAPDRRNSVPAVIEQALPGRPVRNDTTVSTAREPWSDRFEEVP